MTTIFEICNDALARTISKLDISTIDTIVRIDGETYIVWQDDPCLPSVVTSE